MSRALDAVAHLLVRADNPPRDIDGMDHERCAALHNAILKHGWVSHGLDENDFIQQSRPWLESNYREGDEDEFDPSVLAFLSKARELPSNHPVHFFYNAWGLNIETGCHEGLFPGSDAIIQLYGTYMEMCSQPDGLMYLNTSPEALVLTDRYRSYNQHTHTAIMHFDETDELEEDQPWQKLESILTVWIEMIQRQKIIAISADTGELRFDDTGEIMGPERDPVTGARRNTGEQDPWIIAPWTLKDLEESLDLWRMIVESIEQKMGISQAENAERLLDMATLDAARIPNGFARRFLSQAQRPRFKFIAPGLRVPTAEEFVAQPFIDASMNLGDQDHIPCILLLRSEGTVSKALLSHVRPNTSMAYIPCGLYLPPCDRTYRYPQEDGCSLVLPFALTSGHAKRSDFTPVDTPDSLLQPGVNPYNDIHPVQLQAFLETVYLNLQRGNWDVDHDGVAGGIDVWKAADTEQGWQSYFVELGPGRYW